jgi:hypothetical protein
MGTRARAVNTWRPPAPDQEGWVHLGVWLRPWEYRELLRLADSYGLTESEVLRAALWRLLRDVAKTGFDRAERR